MVKDHMKDVKEFERESTKGEDAAIKGFATDSLKTLRDHLQLARDTATAVGAKIPAETKDEKAATTGTSGATGASGTTSPTAPAASNEVKSEPKK